MSDDMMGDSLMFRFINGPMDGETEVMREPFPDRLDFDYGFYVRKGCEYFWVWEENK